jgi:predicted PurR-regulated permease PerM
VSAIEITGIVAIILMSAFAIVAVIVAVPLFRLINRVRFLAEKLNTSLIPMVEKLNTTVSHLNSEISSISELTQSVGSIVEQLEKIIRLARIIITNPLIKLIGAGAGVADSVRKAANQNKKPDLNKTSAQAKKE